MTATSQPMNVPECRQAISDQAEQFVGLLRDADLDRQVPTCPEWTVGALVGHVGGTYRWAAAVVDRQSSDVTQLPDRNLHMPAQQDELAAWLLAGASQFVESLGAADPDGPLWNPAGDGRTGLEYWARRILHETTVHRVDAAIALNKSYELDAPLAADAISEWLALVCSPGWASNRAASAQALCGSGQTLHLHATDEPGLGEAGEWLIRLDPDGARWEHGHLKADVAVRGPAVLLMLVLARRAAPMESAEQGLVEIIGATDLLMHWLGSTAF